MQRQPNFENLRRTILRQGPPGPVPFLELLADLGIVEAVLGEKFPIDLRRYLDEAFVDVSADELPGLTKAADMFVRFWYEMGYDYVPVPTDVVFHRHLMPLADTAALADWVEANATGRMRRAAPSRAGLISRPTPGPKLRTSPS